VSLRPNKGVTFCEKIVLKNLIISLNLSIWQVLIENAGDNMGFSLEQCLLK
jgi:hypothetical protein